MAAEAWDFAIVKIQRSSAETKTKVFALNTHAQGVFSLNLVGTEIRNSLAEHARFRAELVSSRISFIVVDAPRVFRRKSNGRRGAKTDDTSERPQYPLKS